MRGRMRGSDTEELVGKRLRSILEAAAAPKPGWVPGRIEEPSTSVEQQRIEVLGASDEPDLSDRPQAPGAGDEPTRSNGGRGRRLRWEPSRPGALAMCLVAVVVAVLSAGLTWWFRPTPSEQQLVNAADAGADATGSRSWTDDPEPVPDPETGSTDQLVISVIGQVREPGLVTVEQGARVADAINAAGGALPETDLSTINLARLVVDGEQIAVGIPGSSSPDGGDPAGADGLLNLNTASPAELESLPGIGPVLAQRIVDFREDNGGFTAVEQLREVSGIGPSVYEEIVDLVTV